MTASALIPQFSVQLDIDAAPSGELVKRLRRVGIAATMTDVFCKAAAITLLRQPAVNGWLSGDLLELHERVSISLATDGPGGVVAPVIHGVERLDWAALAIERKRVVDGARAGRLHSDHLAGGTFSISNVGPLGGDLVVPLLTPPQLAILGLGRVRDTADAQQVLTATLVADHRVLDGADAVRFLTAFAEVLSDADRLLLAGAASGALRV
jgi:pyruvate dehydrogenase E2 component (dihydrolipoamide acetyltransferase)